MEQLLIDNYTSKCTMIVNGVEKEITFCKNDFGITFIYMNECLVCIFIPENTAPYIKDDIKRIYDEKSQIISMNHLDEVSFSYGLIIGMSMEEALNVN
jgi:hypothetical protein